MSLPVPEGVASGQQAASRELLRPEAASGEAQLHRLVAMIADLPSPSLGALARAAGVTPIHLRRLFKRETGADIRALLLDRRLQTAAELLSGSDLPIKQIAYQVGYQHHPSFVRAFHRHVGETPSSYRKRAVAASGKLPAGAPDVSSENAK